MAATISMSCPQCKKQLTLPETLVGKKIRCKECSTVIAVQKPAPAAAAAPAKAAKKDEEDGGGTYGFVSDDAPLTAPVVAPKPPAPPPPSKGVKGKNDDDEEGSNPYGVTETDLTARCPHCAKEMESEDAVICLHCGYNTQTRRKAEVKRVYDITPHDKFMWLLPGFINVFLILFVIGLTLFFCFGLKSTWAYLDEETTPHLSRGIRFWFVCGALFAIYKCSRFAYKRLIMEPMPPEQEKK